ncbi:MAG TPA: S41 family peptidase [Gemmatimonadales bacterium]|nr:S41 family peptidase [Gemmatimonadales bacterium]
MNEKLTSSNARRWLLVVLIGGISFASGGWLLHGTDTRAAPSMGGDQLFEQVLGAVRQYYVDSLPNDTLMSRAAHGLLYTLGDPYSTLLEGEDYRQLTEQTTGNYGGLGIQIDVRDGAIVVVAPLPQTPAERAGIEAGDQIVAIDGKTTSGFSQDDALKTLRGEPGTSVNLQVRRPGLQQLLPFKVTRETIHSRSVQTGTMLDDRVGLIQLNPVSETSATELRQEIERLRKSGMKALILDLRGNPGGLLDQGVAVSDLFLDEGQQIVSTRGRAEGMSRSFADEHEQRWPEMPVAVLVNQWSASAAEIIAGALQDNDRAVVVGVPTFGKGLVQSLFRLDRNRALKLTTARWYTPSGRSIQRDLSSEEEQVRGAEERAGGLDQAAIDSLPTHRTISGRIVRGGGGIVPDRVVTGDTVTTGERDFLRELGGGISDYRDALVSTAIAIKERGLVSNQGFQVTDQMRQMVFDHLARNDVNLTDEAKQGGRKLIDEWLSYEISRYVFGREVELRRRARDDNQVSTALELLQKAESPAALMAEIAQR